MTISGPDLHVFLPKASKIAFAFSSKERMHFTQQTIAPLLQQNGYDIFWFDGSQSDEGRALPLNYAKEGRIAEVHLNVIGGADAAIVYAFSTLLDRGYDYIGLLENDVLLQAGWWPKLFDLFARGENEGLTIGAVSARCHNERILVPRDGYGVMSNNGAGMALFTREAVQKILGAYRTGSVGEVAYMVENFMGLAFPVPWQVNEENLRHLPLTRTTADWFFEVTLMASGMASLALTPTYARNLDDPDRHPLQEVATQINPEFDWQGLCHKMQMVRQHVKDDVAAAALPHYDPVLKQWRAYPHQILKALPQAFDKKWKMVWGKFMGPFVMRSLEAGASFTLPVHGGQIDLLFECAAGPLNLIINDTHHMNLDGENGWRTASLFFPTSAPQTFKIAIGQADVNFAAMMFEGPQGWFKKSYDLHHSDLAPYIYHSHLPICGKAQ